MEQRELIEIHSRLMRSGWEIRAEITNRLRAGEAKRYTLTHPEFENGVVEINLLYPSVTGSGLFELNVADGAPKYRTSIFESEGEAQFALSELCENVLS